MRSFIIKNRKLVNLNKNKDLNEFVFAEEDVTHTALTNLSRNKDGFFENLIQSKDTPATVLLIYRQVHCLQPYYDNLVIVN